MLYLGFVDIIAPVAPAPKSFSINGKFAHATLFPQELFMQ